VIVDTDGMITASELGKEIFFSIHVMFF